MKIKMPDVWALSFWAATFVMALALPVYAAVNSLPSKELVQRTIVATCPASVDQKCMETADLLQAVGSFYEVVIIVLVALLAAVVSLVYLSIRASSKRQIEEQFEKDIDAAWFQDRLQQKVNATMNSTVAELTQRIEVLEQALARSNARDNEEDAVSGTIVELGGENGAR